MNYYISTICLLLHDAGIERTPKEVFRVLFLTAREFEKRCDDLADEIINKENLRASYWCWIERRCSQTPTSVADMLPTWKDEE